MDKTKQSLEEVLFQAAVQKTDARERSEFLGNVCRNNPALQARLEVMVEGHFAATEFLTVRSAPLNQSSPNSNGEASARMIGRYKLLEKLGEGGFGEVWMAEQREPVRRAVALKIIKLGMDTRQVV